MRDMGAMFTLYWTQTFIDGLQEHGEKDIVMLPRAGWVGTWRHGGVLWSGDIGSTMATLKVQQAPGPPSPPTRTWQPDTMFLLAVLLCSDSRR